MVRWNIKTRRGRLDLDRTRSVWLRFREYIQPHRRSLFFALLAAVAVIGRAMAQAALAQAPVIPRFSVARVHAVPQPPASQ